MRVLHLCSLPVAEDHPDIHRVRQNHKRWVLNLAKAQRAHTSILPECAVVVPGTRCVHHSEIEGIRVHYLPAMARGRASTFFVIESITAAHFIRELKPDLLHAHGSEESNLLIAQKSGLPYVFTAQGLLFLICRAVKHPWLCREHLVELLEHQALRSTPFGIAKSQYVYDCLKTRYPKISLSLIPNTFDPAILSVDESRKTNALVFVGDIIPRKGFDLFREALAAVVRSHPEVEVHVAGNRQIRRGYEQEELNQMEALMGRRLHLHGVVSSAKLWPIIAQATALVAPSREEMFGNQVVEAILLGTHAIVTEETAMAEHVRMFGNGIVVPQENPSALTSAILARLSRSPTAHEQTEARLAACRYMDPQKVAHAHYVLYTNILR
jgi:glycosyltransferase involved in cell wall biosynthesis